MYEDYPLSRSSYRYTKSELEWLNQNSHLGPKECAKRLKRDERALRQRMYKMGLYKPSKERTYDQVYHAMKYTDKLEVLIHYKRQHLAKAILELREELGRG